MEELELDLNEITPAGAAVLGACLVGKRALKRLSLRENELEDAGAVEVARSLALNPALEVLDLCANQVRACSLGEVMLASLVPELGRYLWGLRVRAWG